MAVKNDILHAVNRVGKRGACTAKFAALEQEAGMVHLGQLLVEVTSPFVGVIRTRVVTGGDNQYAGLTHRRLASTARRIISMGRSCDRVACSSRNLNSAERNSSLS